LAKIRGAFGQLHSGPVAVRRTAFERSANVPGSTRLRRTELHARAAQQLRTADLWRRALIGWVELGPGARANQPADGA